MTNLTSGNLGAETNSSFGIGRRSSAALLVTSLSGKDKHRLLSVEEHGTVEDDVVVHSYGHFFQCAGIKISVRHRFKQIALDGLQKAHIAVTRRLDHLRHPESGPGGDRVAPEIGKTAGALIIDRKSAGKLVRLGSALTASLDAAVTTDRHDAAFIASKHAADQSEIHDRFHIVHSKLVLREPHAIDKHGAAGVTIKQRKPLHFPARQPGTFLEHLPGLSSECGFKSVVASCALSDELLIYAIQRNECFDHSIDKRDVAADPHLEKIIHKFGAEQRAGSERGRRPVAL